MPSFPFHDQDCYAYCGPACLMIMLENQGIDLTTTFQSHLMNSIILARQVPGIAWDSSPEAMVKVANDMLGAPPPDPVYEIYPPKGSTPPESDYYKKIQASITNMKAPVFLLTSSGGHWVISHKATNNKLKVISPSSLEYDRGDTVPHDSSKCSECGAGTSGSYLANRLFTDLITPVISSDPTYNSQRIMLVPRRPAS